jgi:HSP20 family protein
MLQVRRDPFGELWGEMARMQDEFNRLFGRSAGGRLFRASGPAVNLWEDDTAVYAELDLPGFNPDKFDVQVTEGNTLTVTAERQPDEWASAVWHRQERAYGSFTRTLTLPVLVDADKVEARYEAGVLRLTLPKSEAAKPRKIAVAAG